MSEGEAEKKKIAELRFGIGEAEANLKVIDEKLEAISKKADKLDLGKNFKVDTTKIKSSYQNLDEMVNKYGKNVTNTYLKGVNVAEKAEKDKEVAAYKHMLKVEEYNARIQKNTKSMYDKITEYAKTYLVYQAFNQLKRAAGELIEEMKEVEYSMVSIDRVLNESSLNIDHYRDKLIQLAHDYGNSFDNVADITLRLAQAGLNSQEALALTEKTLLALNTAELDATQATADMVAVMSQWNLMTGNATEKAYEYGKIIDKVNKVADNFPTTSADIMDALKKVSSAFNLAGASIDETIATIVAAEKASQRGGKVIGTALSNITQQLRAEGRLNIAKEMGLDFFTDDAETNFKPIMEIFQEMAERMEKLKAEGKESSVEMQNLLELFTVFRRNIGASLLGEMSGENSTYMKVLETSINSYGYSLQENEKHMKTARAAQEQFNATLLQLKTSVWDNGLEDVFRSMLMLGNDTAKAIKFLTDTFGSVPTAIGVATAAFTMFNKNMQAVTYNAKTNKIEMTGFFKSIAEGTKAVRDANKGIIHLAENQGVMITEAKGGIKVWAKNSGEVVKYGASLAGATLKTIGLQAATIALNAALSLGISAGITLIITGLDKLIHAEENYIKQQEELIQKNNDAAASYNEKAEALETYLRKINELTTNSKTGELVGEISTENLTEVINLQTEINAAIKEEGKSVELVTSYLDEQGNVHYKISENYKEELKIVKELQKAERERAVRSSKDAINEAEKVLEKYKKIDILTASIGEDAYMDTIYTKWSAMYNNVETTAEKMEILNKAKDDFEEKFGDDKRSSKYIKEFDEKLEKLKESQEKVNDETAKYIDLIDDMAYDKLFSDKDVKNAEDFQTILNEINLLDLDKLGTLGIDTDKIENLDDFKNKIVVLAREDFPEYAKQADIASGAITKLKDAIELTFSDLDQLVVGYDTLTQAMNEFNSTGSVTYDTMNSLINNNLLQYLDFSSNKLAINEAAFANAATAAKANAQYQIAAEAAVQLATLAYGEEAAELKGAEVDTKNMTKETKELYNKLVEIIPKILDGADAWQEYRQEMGSAFDELDEEASIKAKNIVTNAANLMKMVNNMTITSVSYQRASARTSNSTTSSAANAATNAAERAAEEAAKKAEEIYKNSLSSFKDYMTEFERLEKRWVTKQKDLGLLNTDDYMYITEQRIKRYQEYLRAVKDANWLKDEDRLELEKRYTEGIEDLQVDYLEYVKDKLDEEIKAYEEANEKKIDLIKEEADARINSLRTTEKETDRIREKEEYQRKREEHLNDISYWEQRTGREAQEALLEARKNLEELDREWNEKQEDWNLDDQIKAIEEQRDAEIKAIEDAQQSEIDAMKAVYDAKVQMFTESGQIIYENSVIQSRNLFNAYKSNFIDPVSNELTKLNQSLSVTTTQTSAEANTGSTAAQQYETYTIKSGDTLTKIARQYGTSIEKILEANPYVTNRNLIYTGKTLQIPKFHEGGIYGGAEEGLAILKRGEMVFKPEWSAGINRMIKYLDNIRTGNTTNISNGPSISVSGDLVRIEASVRNQNDIDVLGRKVEKILKDKFNIKK